MPWCPPVRRVSYSATYGDGIGIPSGQHQEGSCLPLLPVGGIEADGLRGCCRLERRRAVPQFRAQRSRKRSAGVKLPKEWLQSVIDAGKISKLGLPVVIPVAEFRDLVGAAVTATLSGADPAS